MMSKALAILKIPIPLMQHIQLINMPIKRFLISAFLSLAKSKVI
jgi:hypothetical protein